MSEKRNARFYRSTLDPQLSPEIFKTNPSRLIYLAIYSLLVGACISLILFGSFHWSVKLVLAFALGQLNGVLGFLSHEILHGSVVKKKWLQDTLAFIFFSPFQMSPTFWRYWHNYLHHGHTQAVVSDPDAYPSLALMKRSRMMRFLYKFAPGSRHPLSSIYLITWFSFQTWLNQLYRRYTNSMWNRLQHTRVNLEVAGLALVAGAYVYFIGSQDWLFLVVIPFAVQNYCLMSYIATNHGLCPLTNHENDILANSLTVIAPKWISSFHFNFGYHVEHHLYPSMNPAHAPKVHEVLKASFPTEYKYMDKSRALRLLYSTPRVYKRPNLLVNPKSLETFQTL